MESLKNLESAMHEFERQRTVLAHELERLNALQDEVKSFKKRALYDLSANRKLAQFNQMMVSEGGALTKEINRKLNDVNSYLVMMEGELKDVSPLLRDVDIDGKHLQQQRKKVIRSYM